MKGGPQFPALSQNSQVCIFATRMESVANWTIHSPSTSTFSRFPARGRKIAVHKAQRNIHIKIVRFGFLSRIIAIKISKRPIKGCNFQAISGSIPWDAKKGSQPDFVNNPHVPWPIKHKAAVIRKVQCNCFWRTALSPECLLNKPWKSDSEKFIELNFYPLCLS